MSVPLETLRGGMEGFVAAVLATVDAEGMPNVSMISQVHYVDPGRVALSYQFFNKTRANLLATRRASVAIFDADSFAQHRLQLEYEETLTQGPLFEAMKAKLAGIASHSGMDGVFRLLGADVFRVRGIEALPTRTRPCLAPRRNLLAAVRATCAALGASRDLDELLASLLQSLARHFDIGHALVLMVEPGAERLYTVASHGYAQSGVGSEVAFGEGVIGVAARERVPIRIGHMSAEYSYGAAVAQTARRARIEGPPLRAIPFPGLRAPESQIALPVCVGSRCAGVIFAESPEPMRFRYDDEDALAVVAEHLGALIALRDGDEPAEDAGAPLAPAPAPGVLTVRYYHADGSVFLDHDYLIKGVAGTILWRLVREHLQTGRVDFTTRELRLDRDLRLPDHAENLDARLILLRQRLHERGACLQLPKTGRGRFRLASSRALALEEMDDRGARAAM